MKTTLRHIMPILAGIMLASAGTETARAQYYDLVSQIPNLISPALSGSLNYKGYVDATATFGVGEDRANFVGLSTSQGFRYSNWFFMGAGIGIDLVTSSTGNMTDTNHAPYPIYRATSRTKAMIPIFSDFRFNFGNAGGTSFFIDIKAGATWLIGSSYLELSNGALSNSAQFLVRPSIGFRVPVNQKNSKTALNVGVTYQLITADNSWGYWSNNYSPTLNSLGVTVGYEW